MSFLLWFYVDSIVTVRECKENAHVTPYVGSNGMCTKTHLANMVWNPVALHMDRKLHNIQSLPVINFNGSQLGFLGWMYSLVYITLENLSSDSLIVIPFDFHMHNKTTVLQPCSSKVWRKHVLEIKRNLNIIPHPKKVYCCKPQCKQEGWILKQIELKKTIKYKGFEEMKSKDELCWLQDEINKNV